MKPADAGGWRRRVGWILIILVVGAVVAGVYRTRRSRRLQARQSKAKYTRVRVAQPRKKPVVVVRSLRIPARTYIRKESVEVVLVEEQYIPLQAYAASLDQVVGKVALVNLYCGEPLIESRYADPDECRFLSHRIGPAKRAVVLKVRPTDEAGTPLRSDDRVDVLVTTKGTVRTLLQDVRVLHVAQPSTPSPDGRFVTFQTSAHGCEKLVLAHARTGVTLRRRAGER